MAGVLMILLLFPLLSPSTRLSYTVCLCSAEEKIVPARGKALISTGLCIAVPEGTYGRVAPRSGLGRSFLSVAYIHAFIDIYIIPALQRANS